MAAARGVTARSVCLALLALILLLTAGALAAGGIVLRSMVSEYAASAARDTVVTAVNDIVKDVMAEPRFGEGELVTFERDRQGNIAAVRANVATVNKLTVEIPVANLLGSALLMNRGPSIPVHVTMLSSSTASFRSELTGAGINQTRHQIFLVLDVQLSFLLPWRDMDTSVQTEILVSETVIVGAVPGSYMNWESDDGAYEGVLRPAG